MPHRHNIACRQGNAAIALTSVTLRQQCSARTRISISSGRMDATCAQRSLELPALQSYIMSMTSTVQFSTLLLENSSSR